MITEEMLRAAADRSCDIYVTHLEQGFDPENQHAFSPEFEKKLKRLRRKADHPVLYRTMQRVASIILAILIAGGAWITVDAEARAVFFGWVKEIYETYFVYRHSADAGRDADSTGYRPTWLPEGYTEFAVHDDTERIMVAYSNESGKILRFNYIHNPGEADWFLDVSQADIQKIFVHGSPAELLIAKKEDVANAIAWTAENGTAFFVTGFVTQNELIAIAESVQEIN